MKFQINIKEQKHDAFWYRVLQVALAENGVQSISKASEVGVMTITDAMELRGKISSIQIKWWDQ